ncbi:MBL fold metallo-hydrolase [Viridibacillus sp. YIM B01967]|uniref:MBL fold metallo-hydrolase n=1 Tax=Viridibacillus soli TaxID=2798301 RepID=A0ABS1HBW2_9BACL|nr:MBL fold metallo-hydrolase [Viridibacillus soli]MBK3496875.1 MBL fold metallo-hydrolase [Viridibacillus soli]
MGKIEQISESLFCIDSYDLGQPNRTSSYLLLDDKIALIETSASPSVPYIIKGLQKLGVAPEDVDYLILTHIHLDHAGGAGLFMEQCKNAKLLVHPKGARHLVDPSRLIASAKSVYGDNFDTLFDPILPVSEERMRTVEDGEKLELGETTLTFYHTKGHANHHISIHESATNGIFVGDTTGVYYPELTGEEFDLIIPSTSPNQFDPEAMEQSIQLYEKLNADQLYFGHYGVYRNPGVAYQQVREWLPIFLKEGKKAMATKEEFSERTRDLECRLNAVVNDYVLQHGLLLGHPVFKVIPLDTAVSAMGIIDYLVKIEE